MPALLVSTWQIILVFPQLTGYSFVIFKQHCRKTQDAHSNSRHMILSGCTMVWQSDPTETHPGISGGKTALLPVLVCHNASRQVSSLALPQRQGPYGAQHRRYGGPCSASGAHPLCCKEKERELLWGDRVSHSSEQRLLVLSRNAALLGATLVLLKPKWHKR